MNGTWTLLLLTLRKTPSLAPTTPAATTPLNALKPKLNARITPAPASKRKFADHEEVEPKPERQKKRPRRAADSEDDQPVGPAAYNSQVLLKSSSPPRTTYKSRNAARKAHQQVKSPPRPSIDFEALPSQPQNTTSPAPNILKHQKPPPKEKSKTVPRTKTTAAPISKAPPKSKTVAPTNRPARSTKKAEEKPVLVEEESDEEKVLSRSSRPKSSAKRSTMLPSSGSDESESDAYKPSDDIAHTTTSTLTKASSRATRGEADAKKPTQSRHTDSKPDPKPRDSIPLLPVFVSAADERHDSGSDPFIQRAAPSAKISPPPTAPPEPVRALAKS